MASKRYKDRPPNHRERVVGNKSHRAQGAVISAIACHSTESQDLRGTWDDLNSLTNWFSNKASDASSHIGVDGDGNSILWVPSSLKAWTILNLNSVTLNIEFVGRAAQPERDWEETQLKTGAKWAAYWALRFNIPAQRGTVRKLAGNAVIGKKGIIRHKDLTDAGFGSHTDPGPRFPMSHFIELVSYYKRNGWTLDISR